MNDLPNHPVAQGAMNTMDAIYQRRSVRSFAPTPVGRPMIEALLDAAVQAPTAMREEPWSFAVIENKTLLNRLSESSKDWARREAQGSDSQRAKLKLDLVNKPDFHAFYDAGTLIVIYASMHGPFVTADCWLAAENLMLAACAKGLGTCVIGFAVAALNTPQWKAELKIPDGFTAIAPVIVGFPASETPPVPRKPPHILTWS